MRYGTCESCIHFAPNIKEGEDLAKGRCTWIPPQNLAVFLGLEDHFSLPDAQTHHAWGCSLHETEDE